MIRALGIDLSARRGLDLALLDGGALTALLRLPDVPAVLSWIAALEQAPSVIGIDAPQDVRLPLLCDPARRAAVDPPPPQGRYLRYRLCDYHLARRGIGLYLSPAAGEPVASWIAVGFALFAALGARGFRLPHDAADTAASLLEVYPFAAFVTLYGAIPPSKACAVGLELRRRLLIEAGVAALPAQLGHDALDAVAAALTAARFAAGRGCALGDPVEGLIALPVPCTALRERYP